MPGNGDSDQQNEYDYIDYDPNRGNNYYRLKQIDFDGEYEYSEVISINLPKENEIMIYPNPVNDKINFIGIEAGEIIIIDNAGRNVLQTNFIDSELNIPALPKGLYFIQIYSDNQVITKKFFKE